MPRTDQRHPRTWQRGHYGAWRAAVATPAIITSAALLLVLFGFLGRWEPAALLGWLTVAAPTCLRPVERVLLRRIFRCREPGPGQWIILDSPWQDALTRAGLAPADLDLYVAQRGPANGFAFGRRSIVVTAALLNGVHAGRVSHNQLVAVLLHEIGHLRTRATALGSARAWLTAPWRITVRAIYRLATALTVPRQPPRLLAGVAFLAFAVATGQAARAQNWPVVALLTALIVCTLAAPLADAAISRSSEHAADRFAADTGMGADLAAAITVLDRGGDEQRVAGRILALHPRPDARARELRRATTPSAGVTRTR